MMQVSDYIRYFLTVQWNFAGQLFTLEFVSSIALLVLRNTEAHPSWEER